MIILLLVICILLMVFGKKLERNSWKHEDLGIIMMIFGTMSMIICSITAIFIANSVVNVSVVDDKIAMYQEENTKIESQIDELVKGYMDYESGTLKEFKAESSITLVSLYPELKSDTLVQTQITTYTENNNKIKALKEELLMKSVYRWWLYFGR